MHDANADNDDLITQPIKGEGGREYSFRYSIHGIQEILRGKSGPLTPAERIFSELLSQPKAVDVKSSFGEYWEFGSECMKMETQIKRLQGLASIFRPDKPARKIHLPVSAAYDAMRQQVDAWIDTHEDELVEWFRAGMDLSVENAPRIEARDKAVMNRRSFVEKAATFGLAFTSMNIFATALVQLLVQGKPEKAAKAAAGLAGMELAGDEGGKHQQINAQLAELMKLNEVINHIDGYIFYRVTERHPEIFPPPKIQFVRF